MSEKTVRLDVGGTIFKTTKATLTKFDGMFRTMFETDVPVEKEESGCIFIDRSPKHFDLILNFMRDGNVALPESVTEVEEICADATYFLLDGLIELCQPIIIENNRKKKFRQIESKQKLVEVVLHSEKPVLLFNYPAKGHLQQLRIPDKISEIEKLIDEYQEKLNFYFLPKHEGKKNWECYLYMDGKSIEIARPTDLFGYEKYIDTYYHQTISEHPELKMFAVAVKEDLEIIFSGDQDKMKEMGMGDDKTWRLRVV